MALVDDVASLKASLNAVDADSNVIAADVTTTAANVQNLINQIPGASTLADIKALAAQATAENAKFDGVAAALTALGTSSANTPPPPPPPPPPTVLAVIPAGDQSVAVGGTLQFAANIPTATFSAVSGTIDANGVYTAPASPVSDVITVTDTASSQSLTINVTVS